MLTTGSSSVYSSVKTVLWFTPGQGSTTYIVLLSIVLLDQNAIRKVLGWYWDVLNGCWTRVEKPLRVSWVLLVIIESVEMVFGVFSLKSIYFSKYYYSSTVVWHCHVSSRHLTAACYFVIIFFRMILLLVLIILLLLLLLLICYSTCRVKKVRFRHTPVYW